MMMLGSANFKIEQNNSPIYDCNLVLHEPYLTFRHRSGLHLNNLVTLTAYYSLAGVSQQGG
jgi:hypothetical protein